MAPLIKRKQMIKNIYTVILFTLLIMSCSSIKRNKSLNTSNCTIVKNDNITIPENYQTSKNIIIQKFINTNSGLQILKIETVQGYDFRQNVILYNSSENENVLMVLDERGIKTKTTIKTLDILNNIKNFDKSAIVGVCENKSSLKKIVEYYLKYNEELNLSVVLSSGKIKDFKDTKFEKELELFSDF